LYDIFLITLQPSNLQSWEKECFLGSHYLWEKARFLVPIVSEVKTALLWSCDTENISALPSLHIECIQNELEQLPWGLPQNHLRYIVLPR